MWNSVRSIVIWATTILLILLWLPLLAVLRLLDRDPVHYRTGRWFRRLGKSMTKINPFWKLDISGYKLEHPRRALVIVCNHQSMADIPLISNLPWEMKWLAKKELFKVPVVGWM
ncbi:MAG TPA: 1-acyl-sn-glycerol-3-phosphate acyltransferase, partial [Balneolales bacterium]|nr:1-acyl-sn-glycerol-3-phosphate acyltransferase [Balneolales bacterium]